MPRKKLEWGFWTQLVSLQLNALQKSVGDLFYESHNKY